MLFEADEMMRRVEAAEAENDRLAIQAALENPVSEEVYDTEAEALLPLSLDSPSSYAAWIAALIFSTVAVSDFGMMRETLYLGAPPLIDLGSHTLA